MNVQKLLARLFLKLPPAQLVGMSGGTPVVIDGHALDPQFQFIAASAAKRPVPEPLTPAIARAGTDLLVNLFGGRREPGVAVSSITIPTPEAALPALVYRPQSQDPTLPALLFFHFGGGVVGNTSTCDAFCTILASIIGCPVVSVDYRLAPEHRWPANRTDARETYRWLLDNAPQFGAPGGRVAVGGDSMGGHMGAVLCQDLKAEGQAQPFLQLLIYPATDLTTTGGSMLSCAESFPLTAGTMAWFMMNYLPEGADPASPALSPGLAPDLSGLAPALVYMAGHDPLRDQGIAYAARLEAAGVKVQSHTYSQLAHGFTAFTGGVKAADRACREIANDAARAWRAMA